MKYFVIAALAVGIASCSDNKSATDEKNAGRGNDSTVVVMELLQKNTCNTCHMVSEKLTGPSFTEIAAKNYTPDQIVGFIYNPKPENWPGYPPMMPLRNVPKEDAQRIAEWIVTLKK